MDVLLLPKPTIESGPGLLFFTEEYNIKITLPRDGDVTGVEVQYVLDDAVPRCALSALSTPGCLCFGPIGQKLTTSVTEACARRPGTAASVSRRRRERRSHALAASQAFERMHMLFCHRVKT